ncbi:hypothetical protein TKK_0008089 [Trichogramma kaykai]
MDKNILILGVFQNGSLLGDISLDGELTMVGNLTHGKVKIGNLRAGNINKCENLIYPSQLGQNYQNENL